MYHILTVQTYQSPGDILELSESIVSSWGDRTSPNLLASLCALTDSLVFPFIIHYDSQEWQYIWMEKSPHVTTSLRSLYTLSISHPTHTSESKWGPTVLILTTSLTEYILNDLTVRFDLRILPLHTSTNPPRYSGVSNRP